MATVVLLLALISPLLSEEIDCRGSFCQCKQNGHCQIYCDTRTDQCKDSSLKCKPGYPCTVYCLGKSVCVDSRVNGDGATDVTMICDGKDACKSSTFNCGSGQCQLECASKTDCEDTKANVGSANGFNCIGFCSNSKGVPKPVTPRPSRRPTLMPTPPTMRPTKYPTNQPTKAPIEPQYLTCDGAVGAECKCNNAQPCIIQCDATDSCKDSSLICPRDYDCTVECGPNGCNKALVTGPLAHNFDINCYGTSSCVDAAVESSDAVNVDYVCSGKDSCKGAGTVVNCGTGRCNLQFTGEASGDSATINSNLAIGFKCEGRYAPCPPNYLPPCPGKGAAACTAAQVFNQEICQCECPFVVDAAGCPGLQVFNQQTCQCQLNCAPGTPTAAQCASQGLVFRDCACYESNYCCLTNPVQQEPKQWAGLCWGETAEVSCVAQPNQRCIWDTRNCLANPPRNALDSSKPCGFSTVACGRDSDCCSEFCKPDGLCR